MAVCWFMNLLRKTIKDVSENKFNLSEKLISLDHQEEHLELKSVSSNKDGLHLFMSFKSI